MARVPLIQEQDHPEFAEVIEKYRSGRRGKLINIYRMLLNAPPLAESWFNHSNTVRWKTTLSGRLREIVIIRMGRLTNSAIRAAPARAVAGARRRPHAGGMRASSPTGRPRGASARASGRRWLMPTR